MARVPSTLIHSRFPGCGRRVWSEGAIYYGVSGVYINGGVRFAAVTPEHGLYHDTLWDVTFNIEAHFCTSRLWDTKGYVGGDAGG
ncbi:hypothetical protein AK812_SmicGene22939 [Symbiodinium microadriaticum]|uniref:Uncharacterized protein n=1 Tax=Symbiodinium microadriaticum TaxID=2951 RepID=A0A1Q9DIH0_SYMMI|nr:hypothetical protein AK812_SmicGene22939 [Symbiodinium microadriaticum]